MAAVSATCNLVQCPVAVISSPQPSPVKSVNMQKINLPSKNHGRCCASSQRSTQYTSDSQKIERIAQALSNNNASDIFVDEAKGIVCYRNESGELVCEGLDEGPHFYPPSVSNFYMPDTRAASILPVFGEGMYEI